MGTTRREGRYSYKLSVILVDENLRHANVASCMLAKLDFQVMVYTSPVEALNFLKDHEKYIDFALVAVNMKEIHGFQFLDISRESHKNLQVIMMSANMTWPTIKRSVELGACFLVKKPLDVNTINNIWQHLDLKFYRMEKIKDLFQGIEGKTDDLPKSENKFKEGTNKQKATHIMWTPFLQRKFLQALELLGEGATPKKIQLIMNVDSVGRKQIAAHLQKHRKKVEKELDTTNANKCSNCASSLQPLRICETGSNTCQYDPEIQSTNTSDEEMSWDQTESTEESQGKNKYEAMRRALQLGIVFDESQLPNYDPLDRQGRLGEVDTTGDDNGLNGLRYPFGDKNAVSETHSIRIHDEHVSNGDAQARVAMLVTYSESEDSEGSGEWFAYGLGKCL